MKRAFFWALPMVLVIGTAARADDVVPAPAPSETAAVAPASAPNAVSLDLQDLKGDALARALSGALGKKVRIDGIMMRGITLKLDGVSRADAMAQIAAALKGVWRRTIVWATDEPREPVPSREKQTVSLHLKKAPCSTAAAIVAAAIGAVPEGHARLAGRVTISGRNTPLLQALDAIATESGTAWRDILVLRLPTAAGRPLSTSASFTASPKNGSTSGKRLARRQRRTRETVLAKYGAKPAPIIELDPEIEEARASIGAFAGIFTIEDRQERVQKARRLRAAMETQNRRLDNFRPENRRLAYSFELRQLRSIMTDYEKLTEDQRKDVKPFVDYVRKRLVTVEAALARPAATTPPSSESPKSTPEEKRADAGNE